jgi:hypothetical protein
MGELIAEDTGVDDTPHSELFVRFATCVVGDERRQYSFRQRPRVGLELTLRTPLTPRCRRDRQRNAAFA